MPRPTSTEIVLVGGFSARVIGDLDALPNVRAATIPDGDDRETRVRAFTASAHTSYAVHDVDPLRDVGRAWVGYFDESAPAGTLEVAVEETIVRLRRDAIELPDYFVVVEPEALPVTERHWWLGAVAGVAPSRVVPARGTASALAQALATLPSGRWWPNDPSDWLRGLIRAVPDLVGRV